MKQQPGRGAAEDQIFVAVPVGLKSIVAPIEALITTAGAKIRDARGTHGVDYARTEKEIEDCLAAIERATHTGLLAVLDVDAPRVEIGGKTYRRVMRSPGSFQTMAGAIRVERTLYREEGQRIGRVTDAITLRAGVVGQGWLPKTATTMAHSMQAGTSRAAKANAEQKGRLPCSRASFDRVAHELAALLLRDHADIEDRITETVEIPAEACSISVSSCAAAATSPARVAPAAAAQPDSSSPSADRPHRSSRARGTSTVRSPRGRDSSRAQ